MGNEAGSPPKLYRMADAAAMISKSLRWLQYHLKANPCGRMAGRTRLFTEADLHKLIASLSEDLEVVEIMRRLRRLVPFELQTRERCLLTSATRSALRLPISHSP